MKLNRWQRVGVVLSVVWALGAAIYISNWNSQQARFIAGLAYDTCMIPVHNRIRTDCSQEYTKAYESSPNESVAPYSLFPIPFGWGIAYLFIRIYRWVKAGNAMRKLILMMLLAAASSSAMAFDVDGFHSGMTREQLTEVATSRGLEAKEIMHGSWAIGKFADYRIDGTFSFCGKSLVLYNRSIIFDVDYVNTLNSFIAKYGQPRLVKTSQQPWGGPGGGNVVGVDMQWYDGNDKITLSFSPEGRDGQGALRYNRAASIGYASKNTCWKEF